MDKNKELIKMYESSAFAAEDFSRRSHLQRLFTAVWAVEAEVNNGGFSQFFFNSSNEYAALVVEALKAIGANTMADICKRAIDVAFPEGLPATSDEISDAAADFPEEVDEALDSLSNEFQDYPDNLTELLYDFVAKHPDQFGRIA